MKRKSLLFIVPLIALVLMSCRINNLTITSETLKGSGALKTETRSVSDVERVSLENMGDLTVVQSDTEGLTVEADDNLLPYIITEMSGRELRLRIKTGYNVTSGTIHYTLKVKTLSRISVAGAGKVTADKLSVGDLALNVAGSGNVKIGQLQGNDLTVHSSGAGDFDIQGKVKTQEITITGAGNYKGSDLQSDEGTVTISGAGDVTIWAASKLDIRITGFGNVNYYGSPKLSQTITGGGGVKSLGAHK